MDNTVLKNITKGWEDQKAIVMAGEELSLSKLQELVKDTYKALYELRENTLVPKEICNVLLAMNSFVGMAFEMEEQRETMGCCFAEEIMYIEQALGRGFLGEGFKHEYPTLEMTDIVGNSYVMDFEKDRIESYINALRRDIAQKPN